MTPFGSHNTCQAASAGAGFRTKALAKALAALVVFQLLGSSSAYAGVEPATRASSPVTAKVGAPVEAPPLLPVGSVAPDFSVTAHDGREIVLSKLKGRQVALYFYPKDDTPGCTKEACEIRDSWTALKKAGVVVLGVSTQDVRSHKAFAEKYQLPFPLLPDEKGEIAGKYRVPVVNGNARRITYLIDKQGRIKFVWPQVNPVGHAAEILNQATSST